MEPVVEKSRRDGLSKDRMKSYRSVIYKRLAVKENLSGLCVKTQDYKIKLK